MSLKKTKIYPITQRLKWQLRNEVDALTLQYFTNNKFGKSVTTETKKSSDLFTSSERKFYKNCSKNVNTKKLAKQPNLNPKKDGKSIKGFAPEAGPGPWGPP